MFAEGVPKALSFEQSGGSPRADRGAAGRVEGGGAAVRERVGGFFTDLAHRREEVKRRCRTILQARAADLTPPFNPTLTTPQM